MTSIDAAKHAAALLVVASLAGCGLNLGARCTASEPCPSGSTCFEGFCVEALVDGGGAVDAGADAGSDAGSDGGMDAGFDAGMDAGSDAGMDAGSDPTLDAGSDAGMDAGTDAGSDAGMDAGMDAGSDAGMNADSDAGMDAGFDAGMDAGNVQVSAGGAHTCALSPAGEIRCWGANTSGQLGYGNTVSIGDTETPMSAGSINLGAAAQAIALGGAHSCALTGGSVRCWGSGVAGRLGYANTNNLGDDEAPSSAGSVALGLPATQIAAGQAHTCAVLQGGVVVCWGRGASGQLGYGNSADVGDTETPASAGAVSVGGVVTQLALGAEHTCALLAGGSVRCWGRAAEGQLGYGNIDSIGDTEAPASAGDVSLGGQASLIVAGDYHTCALLTAGTIRCWGSGAGGRLGYGNINNIGDNEVPSSAGFVFVGGAVTSLTAGGEHTCALLSTGVVCWGTGTWGNLGYGNTSTIGDDEPASSGGTVQVGAPVRTITAGQHHTCGASQSSVHCWGEGALGRLGYGNVFRLGDDELPSTAGAVPVF